MFVSELINEIIESKNSESSDEMVNSIKKDYKILSRESYEIENDEQANFYNKPKGKYDLLSIPNPNELISKQKTKIINVLAEIFQEMIGNISNKDKILVVGLGNRHISADSLGTNVIKKINITLSNKYYPKVMAICPSVLGLTGIETYDIVKGVIDRIKPSHIIFIDSLCASDISRLGCSIQITNTGICPGSGIGNARKCLDGSLAKKVFSIGVPLLTYASTFVDNNFERCNINLNRINSIMQKLKKCQNSDIFLKLCESIKQCLKIQFKDEIVTIKDIEQCVSTLSDLIAFAINKVLNVAELN